MFFVLVATVFMALVIAPTDDDGHDYALAQSAGSRSLRIGWVGFIWDEGTLNPLLYTMMPEWTLIWPCYSTLLTYDSNVTEIEDLACAWKMSPDSLNVTRHASDLTKMCSGMNITVVARYNRISHVYESYIPGLPPTDFVLIPGEAYWVYATGSGWIIYSP